MLPVFDMKEEVATDTACTRAIAHMRCQSAHLQLDDGLDALLQGKAGRTPAPDALQGGGSIALHICTMESTLAQLRSHQKMSLLLSLPASCRWPADVCHCGHLQSEHSVRSHLSAEGMLLTQELWHSRCREY